MSYDLVFVYYKRLVIFCRQGHFVVMNATHCIKKLGWLLYNLMMWDEDSNWISEAHVLTAMKDSNIVAAELQQISLSCSTVHLLSPLLYKLSDDVISDGIFTTCSSTTPSRSNAQFKRSFLIAVNEQEMSHLLCKVHSAHSLQKALSDPVNLRCREHLFAAKVDTAAPHKLRRLETSRAWWLFTGARLPSRL